MKNLARLKKYEKENPITFDKESHTYHHKSGEQYYGFTSLIKKYEKPFDRDNIAKGVAFKQGRSVEDVLAEWKEKADVSIEYGNLIHDSYEEMFKNGTVNPACETELLNIQNLLSSFGLKVVRSELIIYKEDIKRASAIDVVALNEQGQIVVCDFKTNKDGVDFESYKDERLLYPLRHLAASKYDKYSLQVSMYQQVLIDAGFDVADEGWIFYIRDEVAEPILTVDYKKEAQELFNYELQ